MRVLDNPLLLLLSYTVPLLVTAVLFAALYWVVRLAVRHGTLDAHRHGPPRPGPGSGAGSDAG